MTTSGGRSGSVIRTGPAPWPEPDGAALADHWTEPGGWAEPDRSSQPPGWPGPENSPRPDGWAEAGGWSDRRGATESAPAGRATAPSTVDVRAVAGQVYQALLRQQEIERDRRGD
ncbi:MAG TPA: hypothetical protein VMU51_22345 [Mycobacteriales bacterium]|nr:hypothetical protein [Mycobacteriales bacterium]